MKLWTLLGLGREDMGDLLRRSCCLPRPLSPTRARSVNDSPHYPAGRNDVVFVATIKRILALGRLSRMELEPHKATVSFSLTSTLWRFGRVAEYPRYRDLYAAYYRHPLTDSDRSALSWPGGVPSKSRRHADPPRPRPQYPLGAIIHAEAPTSTVATAFVVAISLGFLYDRMVWFGF